MVHLQNKKRSSRKLRPLFISKKLMFQVDQTSLLYKNNKNNSFTGCEAT